MKKILMSIIISLSLYNVAYTKDDVLECFATENVKCLERLANKGDVEAQYNLGLMYFVGQGTILNDKKAYIWFFIAQGNSQKVSKDLDSKINRFVEVLEKILTLQQQITEAKEEAERLQSLIKKNKKNKKIRCLRKKS